MTERDHAKGGSRSHSRSHSRSRPASVASARAYEVLGLVRSCATKEEAKKAYTKLIKKVHPDKGGNAAQFQHVQKVRDTLHNNNIRNIRIDWTDTFPSTFFLFLFPPRDSPPPPHPFLFVDSSVALFNFVGNLPFVFSGLRYHRKRIDPRTGSHSRRIMSAGREKETRTAAVGACWSSRRSDERHGEANLSRHASQDARKQMVRGKEVRGCCQVLHRSFGMVA